MNQTLHSFLILAVWCGVIWLVVWGCRWAARDGKARGKPGWLVAIVVVWLFPWGTLLWFLLRPRRVPPPAPVGLKFHPPGSLPPTSTT